MITNFITYIKEEVEKLDYSSYSKSLSEEEFIHILNTDCSDSNIHKIQLRRELNGNDLPKMMLIDSSKHEIRYNSPERYHNYMWYHIIDKSNLWGKEYPNKYRSSDFWISNSKSVSNDSSVYILIPFNNARIAIIPELMGFNLYFINKTFGTGGPASLCKIIQKKYESIFNRKIDYTNSDTTLRCLNELNDNINDKNKLTLQYNIDIINKLKNNMKETNLDLVSYLDYILDPKKNKIELINTSDCNRNKHYPNENGWTDSKILMIENNYYNKIKNKL